jgi:Tol biopolymer transport system component
MIRKPTASFKPRLEALEERWCPAKPGGGGALTNPALAFIAPAQKSAELFVTTADGSATRQLTSDSFDDHSPSWSPDGTTIAFLRRPDPAWARSDLYTIKPDGSGLTLVRDFSNTPGELYPGDSQGGVAELAWSPDSSKILYTSPNRHEALLLLDVATGAIQHLSVPGLFYLNDPDWSPDLDSATPGYQGMILFSAVVTTVIDGEPIANSDLFVLNVTMDSGAIQTGQLTNLTNTPGNNIRNEVYPEWSPSGASIVFSERNFGLPTALKVLSLEVSGSGLSITVQVTGTQVLVSDVHGNAEPVWSPDGQYVAFYNTRQANPGTIDWDLYRIRPDGTQLTNVTRTDRRREHSPDWNPAWVNALENGLQAEAMGGGSSAKTLTVATDYSWLSDLPDLTNKRSFRSWV